MPVPFAARLPQGYREWNELLIEELFPRGRAGVPVYLAVHDRLLDACGAACGRGGRDEFVGAVLGLCPPPRLFAVLGRLAEMWSENGRGGLPPFVAGLGLAVLAAGEMATDESATQANYYVRLNTLLGIESRDRPEGFECTLELWQLLQAWLRDERRGELVVRGADGARRFVDPVKSQCLVRSCDVEDLLPLLRDVEVNPGQFMEPEDVLPLLRVWLLGAGTRSRLARLLERDPDDGTLRQAAEALCDAVEDYCAERPLSTESARPTRPRRALLAIRPNRYPNLMWRRAEWIVRLAVPLEADEPECLVAIGDRVGVARLDAREPATYDLPVTLAEAGQLLSRQIRVADEDGNDVTPQPRPPMWFQDSSVRGRPGSWDIVDAPAAGVPHTVVVLESSIFDQIRAATEQTPMLMSGTPDTWPGSGVLAVCAAVPRAGATLPGNITVQARPPILRLSGGLPLRRRVYLRGALPVPLASDAAPLHVEHGDRPDVVHVTTCGEATALDLPEGPYALRCEGATADIFVVEPRWRECMVPQHAPLDQEVRAALFDATVRGSLVAVQRPVYATYFRPGTPFRIYAPHMQKGVAPADSGICEVKTSEPPREVVVLKRPLPQASPPRAACFRETTDGPNIGSSEYQWVAMDRLLEYVSARGAGPIAMLRPYCASIAGERTSWHSTLSVLEDLGHLDICWADRRWTVAPASIAARAVDDGHAVLVGTRARQSVAWLRQQGIDAAVDDRALHDQRGIMPTCIVIRLDTTGRAATALSEAGVRVLTPSTATAMAVHVRSLSETSWWVGAHFAPSTRVRRTLERWDPLQLRWTAHGDAADLDGPALYRWREYGLVIHYIVNGALRARVRDPAAAKWAVAPSDRSHLVYEPKSRRLVVPLAIGLPRIWRRICTTASGLMPIREGRLLAYEGIPLELARAVAVRLNQSRTEGLS